MFASNSITCPGWPVRIQAAQGLWRYTGQTGKYIEVIGPYFPNNPDRNGGRSRIVKLEDLKYAGKNAKPIDVTHVQTTAISDEAKRARRR